MKTRILALSALVLAFGMTSCENTETEEVDEKDGAKICEYSYNEGMTEFEWTSYKTSAKVPVKGTFNEIRVESDVTDNALDVIKSIEFSMNTSTVETNDESRNGKVAEFFFKTINTVDITGKVASVNEETGKAAISITMNDITIDVEGDYTMVDDKFSWTSSINVSSWNALSGIEALNEACKELHTGDDGVSKLWSEVGLSFSTTVSVNCD